MSFGTITLRSIDMARSARREALRHGPALGRLVTRRRTGRAALDADLAEAPAAAARPGAADGGAGWRDPHNIEAIRASGCAVPKSAHIDTLDPVAIEMWFLDSAERRHRLTAAAEGLAGRLPDPG